MRMSALDVLREFPLDIKMTFRGQRVKTKPEGRGRTGREKLIQGPAQVIDIFHPWHATDLVNLLVGQTAAGPDLTLSIGFGHKQALTDEVAPLLEQEGRLRL